MKRNLQVFYSVFSAIITAAALPNEMLHLGSPFLGLFALVPLYFAVSYSSSARFTAFLFSIHFGIVHLISSFWLGYFKDFAVFTLGGTFAFYICCGFAAGFIFHPVLARQSEQIEKGSVTSPAKRIFMFAALWTLYEWFKSTGFMGYPWGTLFNMSFCWPLITQIADITGVWGISALFALFSACVGEGLVILSQGNVLFAADNRKKYAMGVCAVICLFTAAAVYGAFQYASPRRPVKTLQTLIVQQNTDSWANGGDYTGIRVSQQLSENEIERTGVKPDLVVWSESVLDRPLPASQSYYRNFPEEEPLTRFIDRIDAPFIIGAPVEKNKAERKYSNSAAFFDKNGIFRSSYAKIQLVPFAEVIPYADKPWVKKLMRSLVGFSDGWTPGTELRLFEVQGSEGDLSSRNELSSNDSAKPQSELSSNAGKEPAAENNASGKLSAQNTAPSSSRDAEKNTKAAPPPPERRSADAPPPPPARDSETDSRQNTNIAPPPPRAEWFSPKSSVKFSTPICFEDAFPYVCRQLYLAGSEVFINITNDSWSKTQSAEYQHFVTSHFRAIEYRTTLVRSTTSGYSAVIDASGRVLYDLPLFTESAMLVPVPVYERTMTVYARFGDWFPILAAVLCIIIFSRDALRLMTKKDIQLYPGEKLLISVSRTRQAVKLPLTVLTLSGLIYLLPIDNGWITAAAASVAVTAIWLTLCTIRKIKTSVMYITDRRIIESYEFHHEHEKQTVLSGAVHIETVFSSAKQKNVTVCGSIKLTAAGGYTHKTGEIADCAAVRDILTDTICITKTLKGKKL